ncbi:MAG: Luciferase-like, subgroup [Acidimicrobiia bacterium]|nr:Luciferase-like, subgroup [Acidimicrobiia bacterium]
MRVGVSLRSGFPPMESRQGAMWMIERARAASAAGLDSLFVGDHHNARTYYQNVPMMGRLLAEWDDRPSGTLFLLPLWHPVLVAEQLGTLASIAQGPFVMQCAIGGGAGQFGAFDVALSDRRSRFEASLDVIRRLCAGEQVDMSQPFQIKAARIAPLPPRPLEVWIGGSAPAAIDRVARLGDVFLIGPEPTVAEVRSQIALYREACERHGRPVGPIVVRRDVHVGGTDAEAEAVAAPVVSAGYRGFDPAALVIGGVQRTTDAFAELGELGCAEVLIRHLAADHPAVLASFAFLGDVRLALQ